MIHDTVCLRCGHDPINFHDRDAILLLKETNHLDWDVSGTDGKSSMRCIGISGDNIVLPGDCWYCQWVQLHQWIDQRVN